MFSLPHELYEHIISYIAIPSNLCKLALVSHRINRIAERQLYQSLKFSGEDFENIHGKIFSRPRPWTLVRHLEILPYPWYPESGCYLALLDTLPLLTGLKHFVLDGMLSFNNPRTETLSCILENVMAPLETLIFQRISPTHLPFIERYAQLRTLIVDLETYPQFRPFIVHLTSQTPWNIAAFPNLHTLGCRVDVMCNYLTTTSSKVSRLKWNHGVIKAWPVMDFIRSMDVTLYSVEIAEFVHSVERFPGLEYLKCSVMRAGFLQLVDEEDLQLLSTLNLPTLHKVYIHFIGSRDPEINQQCLFDAIASLQIVQLQLKNAPGSRCWFRRDPSTYVVVSSHEDEWKYYNAPCAPARVRSRSGIEEK